MKGLCPFHDERSPSFNVRPQVGFYHCFGCGESGDVYSFLREMDHVSFTEAVERLAGRIGYTLHYEDGGAAPETTGRAGCTPRTRLPRSSSARSCATPEAETARRFLGERGFDAGAAAHFGVGYAPKGWSNLRDALHSAGVHAMTSSSAAGLVSQGQRGVYDRFRGRAGVADPRRHGPGRSASARASSSRTTRARSTSTPPRPRSTSKSQVLYGLDLAKRDISRDHRVVVVEGYTDVMACHLAGITTAIATLRNGFRRRITSRCCGA